METKKEQLEKQLKQAVSKGNKKVIAMIEKKIKRLPKSNRISEKKFIERARTHVSVKKWEGLTIAEINRLNALTNLPSSMQ